MSTATLLSRLGGVRERGSANWVARCPAHEDRSPSLSIRETDDGMTLLHCFAGCGVEEVLTAVGIEFSALFPERLPADRHARDVKRPRLNGWDAIRALRHDLSLIVIVASDMRDGKPMTRAHLDALGRAIGRLHYLIGAAQRAR